MLLALQLSAEDTPPNPPAQPLPFSHKTHADVNATCLTCHPNSDPGKNMGIVRPSACMGCHNTVKTKSPAIRQLAALAKKNQDIPWTRVYRIPEFVIFSHRLHLEKGNTCDECHGPVATRTQLAVEYDLKQTGCLACHRVKKAPMLCTTCHV
jgi:c(7)-type cytochrome triheme protein